MRSLTSRGSGRIKVQRRLPEPISFFLAALLVVASLARGATAEPTYTDAFYHINAASRLARGGGFVEDTLWNYLDAPMDLPAPSHRYWMPLTSVLAALGMTAFGAPGDYDAAQAPFILLAAGAGVVAYATTLSLAGNRRNAWTAGLLTAFGGFFAPRWGAIDTFAPYALIGSLALLCSGKALMRREGQSLYWVLTGCLAALGHLTRPDGLLLLISACYAAIPARGFVDLLRQRQWTMCLGPLLLVSTSYLLLMLPWFARNIAALGLILPAGGLRSIGFSQYDELFRYPSTAVAAPEFGDAILRLLEVRWTAALHGFGTLIAVEGLIVLSPFMLIGWWLRRHHPLLRGFTVLAIGIHILMILVFPLPGYRGGLFHAVAALFPFWMALSVLGLDAAVEWVAKRRRAWNAEQAKRIFSLGALVIGVLISLSVAQSAQNQKSQEHSSLYEKLRVVLPAGARVMINDPARLFYHLGHGGVTIPNESVEVVPEIAKRYGIGYLVLEHVGETGYIGGAPAAFQFDVGRPPDFLRAIAIDGGGDHRLYQIVSS